MKANVGDRIVLRSRYLVRPIRDGEIINVLGWNGGPPYLIQWSDSDGPTVVFPGSNAHILPKSRRPRLPESSP